MSKASCICGSPHGQHYADCPVLLRSEITRLRNELHLAQEWSARVIDGQEQDMTEITRLRAEVEKLKDFETEFCQQNSDLGKALLENEKLKAALRQIAGIDTWDDNEQGYVDKARAALGDTP